MYPLCHKKTFVVLILSVTLPLHAQRLLTLEDCRDLAATDNKQAQIDHEAELSAKYMRQAAIANFFPQISANGAYLYNQKHLHILGEDSEFSWGTIGNSGIRFNDPTIQTIGALFPTLSQGVNRFTGNAYNDFYNLFDFRRNIALIECNFSLIPFCPQNALYFYLPKYI